MEEERREHVMKMKKMEAEMEQVFEMKVKEKKQKLKDSEAEVGLEITQKHQVKALGGSARHRLDLNKRDLALTHSWNGAMSR